MPIADGSQLRTIFERRLAERRGDTDLVFHWRGGKPIRNFRESWKAAVEKAGMPDLLFHDLRRSAVRDLVRSGVPEGVAMEISGHKTRSVFERYNIVNEDDLREAMKAREEYARKHRESGKAESV